MSPSTFPITPPHEIQQVSDLTAAAISHKLEETILDSHNPTPHHHPLNASLLHVTKTSTPMLVPSLSDPIISTKSQCTDHMITCTWNSTVGWSAPLLKPYGNLSLPPTASVLHYATECFEGLKMYRGYDGKLRLFRPDLNCNRLLMSATRISLPAFDPREVQRLIMALVAIDGPKWLPKDRKGTFLYLRPTMIGSAGALGVASPKEAMLFIITTFMQPFSSPHGLRLLASTDSVRAWPGGFGFAKLGANYGPTLMANAECQARGFDTVLWLLDGKVTEAGASNFFVVWKTSEGKTEMVTAPLDGKIILDGVTRRSILELCRSRLCSRVAGLEKLEVMEREFGMEEIAEAVQEGRIVEAFLAGTAYFVSPVSCINYRDEDLSIPMVRGESGEYAAVIKQWIGDIMYGNEQHEWGVVVEEMEV